MWTGLEKTIGEDDKIDIARYFTIGAWVPSNCRLTQILKPCTDNFIGACVHGVDDGCCESICKHSGNDKRGFCKPISYKQSTPHNFCHCYC